MQIKLLQYYTENKLKQIKNRIICNLFLRDNTKKLVENNICNGQSQYQENIAMSLPDELLRLEKKLNIISVICNTGKHIAKQHFKSRVIFTYSNTKKFKAKYQTIYKTEQQHRFIYSLGLVCSQYASKRIRQHTQMKLKDLQRNFVSFLNPQMIKYSINWLRILERSMREEGHQNQQLKIKLRNNQLALETESNQQNPLIQKQIPKGISNIIILCEAFNCREHHKPAKIKHMNKKHQLEIEIKNWIEAYNQKNNINTRKFMRKKIDRKIKQVTNQLNQRVDLKKTQKNESRAILVKSTGITRVLAKQ